jgi:hypothetical protein
MEQQNPQVKGVADSDLRGQLEMMCNMSGSELRNMQKQAAGGEGGQQVPTFIHNTCSKLTMYTRSRPWTRP